MQPRVQALQGSRRMPKERLHSISSTRGSYNIRRIGRGTFDRMWWMLQWRIDMAFCGGAILLLQRWSFGQLIVMPWHIDIVISLVRGRSTRFLGVMTVNTNGYNTGSENQNLKEAVGHWTSNNSRICATKTSLLIKRQRAVWSLTKV